MELPQSLLEICAITVARSICNPLPGACKTVTKSICNRYQEHLQPLPGTPPTVSAIIAHNGISSHIILTFHIPRPPAVNSDWICHYNRRRHSVVPVTNGVTPRRRASLSADDERLFNSRNAKTGTSSHLPHKNLGGARFAAQKRYFHRHAITKNYARFDRHVKMWTNSRKCKFDVWRNIYLGVKTRTKNGGETRTRRMGDKKSGLWPKSGVVRQERAAGWVDVGGGGKSLNLAYLSNCQGPNGNDVKPEYRGLITQLPFSPFGLPPLRPPSPPPAMVKRSLFAFSRPPLRP